MKFNFDMDCTPEEARKFFGLPDIAPMQDAVIKEMQAKLADNISKMDPETLARTWIPATLQNFTEMQKMFWSQVKNANMGKGGTGPMGSGMGPGINPMNNPMNPMAGGLHGFTTAPSSAPKKSPRGGGGSSSRAKSSPVDDTVDE